MAWTVLLLGLLAHSSGVDAQAVVTQEPSLSVSLAGTATLTCASSSGSVTTSNYPDWYQQTPGQAPRTLMYNTNSRPSGVPDRFSGSISGNKAALTITGAQPEDEAEYYCALWHSDHSHSDRQQVHQADPVISSIANFLDNFMPHFKEHEYDFSGSESVAVNVNEQLRPQLGFVTKVLTWGGQLKNLSC